MRTVEDCPQILLDRHHHFFFFAACSSWSRIAALALLDPPSFGPLGPSFPPGGAAGARCCRDSMDSKYSVRNCSTISSSYIWIPGVLLPPSGPAVYRRCFYAWVDAVVSRLVPIVLCLWILSLQGRLVVVPRLVGNVLQHLDPDRLLVICPYLQRSGDHVRDFHVECYPPMWSVLLWSAKTVLRTHA
jgi:hypothetical protein